MGIFNFGKKKEKCAGSSCCSPKEEVLKASCACGSECGISSIEKARFIVLGACCKKSQDTFENTKKAVADMGFEDEVLNIGSDEQIAKYGVMQTPALVIDSKVMSYGKLLSVNDVKELIKKSGIK